ncbi:hypothetical protein LSTR_LSTR009963 [Laodelphax striatellus]|uniref:Uncharacterized protein n=1 Tax=Laodelphax striatellus TaxID=195883 RepID=A0A482XHE4_LAOST|nr:hypothetical protein LSTR_LSTR009963 [Laodelphax striatellus]
MNFGCVSIAEKNDYMWRLLVALVGERQERAPLISGWEQRGALIWHYLRVVDEVKAALERRNPYSLEKLQPELTSLCTRIVLLPTPTSLHRLCQAEIVKRIANLIYSLFVLQRKEGDFDSVSRLARLISNLPLPEDYAHQEMRQMVTSWLDTTL